MRRSTDRILVSHAGSLPPPPALTELVYKGPDAREEVEAALPEAVADVVAHQAAIGIDVVNDGEVGKRGGFLGYIRDRITGVEEHPELDRTARDASVIGRDRRAFPGFYAAGLGMFHTGVPNRIALSLSSGPWLAVEPLRYVGHDILARDIALLKKACDGLDVEPYLPATAPGTIEHWLWGGDIYKTDEELLFAIADVVHEEYKAITDAGILLQVDDPDMADGWQMFPDMTIAEYRRYAQVRAEALNHALRDIPQELTRFHVCWGSMHGPHRDDIPLRDFVDIVLSIKAGCYSIESANPRHEHEWKVWEDVKLPDGASLMPGVVGHAADLIEHPELVAQRLVRYANLVGRENVVAGTDCGLGGRVHPEIAWAKLEDLVEGAKLATRELWPA